MKKTIILQIDTKSQCTRIIRDALTACIRVEVLGAQISCFPNLDGLGTVMTITNVIDKDIETILVVLDNVPIIKSWNVLSYEEPYI